MIYALNVLRVVSWAGWQSAVVWLSDFGLSDTAKERFVKIEVSPKPALGCVLIF